MVLKARWILSVALLALPIAITLGVLLGIDSHRRATGQPTFFRPETGPKRSKGVEYLTTCNKVTGFGKEYYKNGAFEYNANPWGVKEGQDGDVCMTAIVNNNQTYSKNKDDPKKEIGPYSVTWNFPAASGDDNTVHAFPNVLVHNVFPETLGSIDKIDIDYVWTYNAGNQNKTTSDFAAMVAPDVLGSTNVAVDFFLDSDKNIYQKSKDPKPKFEIMVWLAAIGSSTKPLGHENPTAATETVDGATFDLKVANNKYGQTVFTWLTSTPVENFHGDIAPLLQKVLKLSKTANIPAVPSKDDYVVYMSLGSELYSAKSNVTFLAREMAVDIQTKN